MKKASSRWTIVFAVSVFIGSTPLAAICQTNDDKSQKIFYLPYSNGDAVVSWDNGLYRYNVYDALGHQFFLSVKYPDRAIVKVTTEQQKKLSEIFKLNYAPLKLLIDQNSLKTVAAIENKDKETLIRLHKESEPLMEQRRQFYWEFGGEIAEVLDSDQLNDLKALAISGSMNEFGGMIDILKKSHGEHDLDAQALLRQPDVVKKLRRIKGKYERELAELRKKAMDEFLDALPAESRAAMEYTIGIDNLKKLPK